MQTRRLHRAALIAAALGLGLGACDESGTRVLTPAERTSAVRTFIIFGLNNPDRVLRAGHPYNVAAQATDRAELPVEGVGIIWSGPAGSGTVAPPLGTTDANGLAGGLWTTGIVAGVQEIVATVDGGSGAFDRSDAYVYPDTVVGRLVLSSRDTIAVGDTALALITEARDQYGNLYSLVGTNPANPPAITFRALDPTIVNLVSTDPRSVVVSGLAPGVGRVVAMSDGRADTVTINVVAPAP